jgi:uncharacterized membrane protein YGL010W
LAPHGPITKKTILRQTFDKRLAYYRSQHRSLGCKITHLVGIPILVLSVPAFFVSRRLAAQLQGIGWLLQLIGHFVYEHNKPVLIEARDPLTVMAALSFIAEEWRRAWNGEEHGAKSMERIEATCGRAASDR